MSLTQQGHRQALWTTFSATFVSDRADLLIAICLTLDSTGSELGKGREECNLTCCPPPRPNFQQGIKSWKSRSQKSQAQAEDLGLSCQGIYSQDPTGGALGRLSAPQRLYFTPNIHLHSCQGPRVQAPSKGSDLCENPTMARTQHGKNPPFWVHSSPFSAFIL